MDLKDRVITRISYGTNATSFDERSTVVNGVFVVTERDILLPLKQATETKYPQLRIVMPKGWIGKIVKLP